MELSRCCSQLGLVHAAVLLQHASLGASLSLQYRSVLHSKLSALDRRRLCGSATPAAEQVTPPPSPTSLSLPFLWIHTCQVHTMELVFLGHTWHFCCAHGMLTEGPCDTQSWHARGYIEQSLKGFSVQCCCSFEEHQSQHHVLDSLHQGFLHVQACAALGQAIDALEAGLLPQPMQPPAKQPGHRQRAMQDLEVRHKCLESVEKEKEL